MKDEIVSFETANLARKKGYPQDTFGTTEMKSACYLKDGSFYPNGCICNIECASSAPTQSMLQRWFREEHKIFIGIQYNGFSKSFYWTCVDMNKGLFSGAKDVNMEEYKTYEEALEDALLCNLKYNRKLWNR